MCMKICLTVFAALDNHSLDVRHGRHSVCFGSGPVYLEVLSTVLVQNYLRVDWEEITVDGVK